MTLKQRIGEIPRLKAREDLADPTFRRILADRFGCTSDGKEVSDVHE